jgi:tetratricopeptide (TPR) repeat protein
MGIVKKIAKHLLHISLAIISGCLITYCLGWLGILGLWPGYLLAMIFSPSVLNKGEPYEIVCLSAVVYCVVAWIWLGIWLFFSLKTRAWYEEKFGNYGAALAFYNRAMALNPQDALVCHKRGQLKEKLGDIEGAESDYAQALKLNPELSIPTLPRK